MSKKTKKTKTPKKWTPKTPATVTYTHAPYLSSKERADLRTYLDVLDVLEQNKSLADVVFPKNNEYILKSLISMDRPDITNAKVNWYMSASSASDTTFLSSYLLQPHKARNWCPPQKDHPIIQNLITSLLDKKIIHPLDEIPTKIIPQKQKASLVEIAVTVDSPFTSLLLDRATSISNQKKVDIIKAALPALSYDLEPSYTRIEQFIHALPCLMSVSSDINMREVKDEDVHDVLRAYSYILRVAKRKNNEYEKKNTLPLYDFSKGIASTISAEQIMLLKGHPVLAEYSMQLLLYNLAQECATNNQKIIESIKEILINAMPCQFNEDHSYDLNNKAPIAGTYPLLKKEMALSREQSLIWLDAIGPLLKYHAPSKMPGFAPVYFKTLFDKKDQLIALDPDVRSYVVTSLEQYEEKRLNIDSMQKSGYSRMSMTMSREYEEITMEKENLLLWSSTTFSSAGFKCEEKARLSPKAPRLL